MVVFSDLDRSIIYSKRFLGEDKSELEIEIYKNENISYISKKTVKLIKQLQKNIEFIPVSAQKLVLIVPSNHELAKYDSITLEQTVEYPQIVFSSKSGLRQIIDNLFDSIGKKPQITYEIEEDQVIAGLVSNNFGIAIVPYMPILKFMDLKTIEIKSPTWERNFYLAVLKDKTLTPIAENFKSFVIENYTLD